MAFTPELPVYLKKFYNEKVRKRKMDVSKTISNVCSVICEVLKKVESLEPRFISSLKISEGRYQGLHVINSKSFEILLFLNQMGVFNFIDDGAPAGCAMLKLCDERKRSMSLWTEFITASGYLSARKMRSRFQSLVQEAVGKCSFKDRIKVIEETSLKSKLLIDDLYTVDLIPVFKCGGIWPRNACSWPYESIVWPSQPMIATITKIKGFDLSGRDMYLGTDNNANIENDSWVLTFDDAQDFLLQGGCRRQCLSILKALRDKHLSLPENPIDVEHITSMVLYECEKHPRESDWDEMALGDRINGVLLQLVSCLQCRRCPNFFLKSVDLFAGKSRQALDNATKQTWRLAREIGTNPRNLDKL